MTAHPREHIPMGPLPLAGEPVCTLCGEPLVNDDGDWITLAQHRYNLLGMWVSATTRDGVEVVGTLEGWNAHEAVVSDSESGRTVHWSCDPTTVEEVTS